MRLGSLCNLLEQLSSRIRNGHSIEVLSFDAALPLPQESLGATPVLGTLKSAPNTYNQRQRISRHENRRNYANKRKNPLLSLVGQSNDLAHVPPPRLNTKTCSICKCPGHQRGAEGRSAQDSGRSLGAPRRCFFPPRDMTTNRSEPKK